MKNGYFRLVNDSRGFGIAMYQPKDGGAPIQIGEVLEYLEDRRIGYERKRIEMCIQDKEDSVCHLGVGDCPIVPETYRLTIREDGMLALARFVPPSEGGSRLSYEDFLRDLRFKEITYNIQEEALREHFESEGLFCCDLEVAKGTEPVQGKDAQLEYCFNTDNHRRPTQNADGSVDYFHLTTINQCKKGDVLARIIPEDLGESGYDIYGKEIKPREVKRQYLKFGRNILLSEDKNTITSMVDGHVSLVDGKVFVQDVYQVESVDVSTGNIEYEGSIEISRDVAANFEVKAGGNVIVNGLVEGAKITAGGNIIIAKGMNGAGKGYLKAGGDVVVKFLENVRVVAGGYLHTEAILHSKVSVGGEVTVEGRKGIIVGGYVQAGTKITAKTIGATMGSSTILEVGVNPLIKTQYTNLQKSLEDAEKTVKDAEAILANFKEKLKKGAQINESQLKYMKSVAALVDEKNDAYKSLQGQMERLRTLMEIQKHAEVVVMDQIHPGTTILIGESTRTIQNDFHYCKFVRDAGEVKMAPM